MCLHVAVWLQAVTRPDAERPYWTTFVGSHSTHSLLLHNYTYNYTYIRVPANYYIHVYTAWPYSIVVRAATYMYIHVYSICHLLVLNCPNYGTNIYRDKSENYYCNLLLEVLLITLCSLMPFQKSNFNRQEGNLKLQVSQLPLSNNRCGHVHGNPP